MISIIVPCYNCSGTIDRCVKSLLEQTDQSYEIILVDDGSNDGTQEICDYYGKKYDNVRTFHKTNGGLVSAWKFGVLHSEAEYVTFCDADDYIEEDLISKITLNIEKTQPDMVCYGMTIEYSNKDKVYSANRLEAGVYDYEKIREDIWPCFFSNGTMQSEYLLKSRCSKVFKRSKLNEIMNDVPEGISFGEDTLTTFVFMLIAEKISVIGEYYPYHYVRNKDSMIGAYDSEIFAKIERLYDNITMCSYKYSYPYDDQIKADKISNLFLYMKKEICRNPNGYHDVNKKLKNVQKSAFFSSLSYSDIKDYGIMEKIFARLLLYKCNVIAYFVTKVYEWIRGRDV